MSQPQHHQNENEQYLSSYMTPANNQQQYPASQLPPSIDQTMNYYPTGQMGQPMAGQHMDAAQQQQQFNQLQFNQFSHQFLANPVMSAAGQQVMNQFSQKLVVESSGWIDRNLRPFFAVDDSYVIKKLAILLFPFAHRQWLYSPEDQYLGPKFNVNAPDLYIPLMAFVTYVLGAGYMLGLEDKFSPEQLGILSSSALVCLSIEVCLLMIIFHFCNVKCWFNFIHYVAYCSYKFVPIILSMLVSLLFKNTGYYLTIAYTTIALGYYMIRSFHVAIEAGSQVHDNMQPTSRLGDYIIGGFSLVQPLFMIWLSYHLVP